MIISIGLFVLLGSTLLLLAEEKEWIIYMKLALFIIVFRLLAAIFA